MSFEGQCYYMIRVDDRQSRSFKVMNCKR